jgi:hypothetical protein
LSGAGDKKSGAAGNITTRAWENIREREAAVGYDPIPGYFPFLISF